MVDVMLKLKIRALSDPLLDQIQTLNQEAAAAYSSICLVCSTTTSAIAFHFLSSHNMSGFGGPGGRQIISKPSPPERGSFPLDHDAECQPLMKEYLKCLRTYRGTNQNECRELSKKYLQCRMDR